MGVHARRETAPRRSALRGVLTELVATSAALCGHLAAGGSVPTLLGLAVPLALSVSVSSVLLASRVSRWRLAVAALLGQLAFHTLFVLGAGAGGARVAHHHHAWSAPGDVSTAGSASGPSWMVSAHLDAPMLVWHIVAAALTVLVIRRGERACRGLADLTEHIAAHLAAVASTLLCDPAHLVVLPRPPRIRERPHALTPRRRQRACRRPLLRRGPPRIIPA